MSCITEILKLKGDQPALIPVHNGEPWIAVEGGGKYRDYEYLIVLNTNGHRCGYVAIPPTHPYSKTPLEERTFLGGRAYAHYDYDSLNIQCHGGLTFMAPDHGLKDLLPIPCTDMWIGFDCGHCDDMSDKEAYIKYFGEKSWDEKDSFFSALNHGQFGQSVKSFQYAEQECHSIIDQLIACQNG